MKKQLVAVLILQISIICSLAEPQDESFRQIHAKAVQMGNTATGKAYEKRFSIEFSKPMDEALRDVLKDLKPPYIVNVVFIINADGSMLRILPAPNDFISEGIAIKLKDLRVSRPPKPGWMVAVNMEINELKTQRDLSEDFPSKNKSPITGGQ